MKRHEEDVDGSSSSELYHQENKGDFDWDQDCVIYENNIHFLACFMNCNRWFYD